MACIYSGGILTFCQSEGYLSVGCVLEVSSKSGGSFSTRFGLWSSAPPGWRPYRCRIQPRATAPSLREL